jgi:hypothetical protein
MIMTGLHQDFRCAVRQLQKNPGFATVVVLTLAVGIVANSAISSVIDAVLLRPLSYRNPEQPLILTVEQDSDIQGEDGGIHKDFSAWKSQGRAFEDIAVYYRNSGWSRVTLNSDLTKFMTSLLFSVTSTDPVARGSGASRRLLPRASRGKTGSHGRCGMSNCLVLSKIS